MDNSYWVTGVNLGTATCGSTTCAHVRARRVTHIVCTYYSPRASVACMCNGARAHMAMGVHMEKDPEPAVDAIATRFSSMLDTVSALTS